MKECIRTKLENQECRCLSKYAQLSRETRGRRIKEEESEIRTCYQRDKDRILHSLYFRLLKYKTNVFLSTSGEKFRTRLTHTLEVAQIARTICRALDLNEDLSEAIALGHDLGHTPFGHTGEEVLNNLFPEGFHHSQQSLRVVDFLEKTGKGLNLTLEVRDGILKHSKGTKAVYDLYNDKTIIRPLTVEGEVVQYSDWIAYINHDIDDAISMELATIKDFPNNAIQVLGETHGKRINTMVCDIVKHSNNSPKINISDKILKSIEQLRSFLYSQIYTMSKVKKEMEKAEVIIKTLYKYYTDNFGDAIKEFPWLCSENKQRIATDVISSMTDITALTQYRKLTK